MSQTSPISAQLRDAIKDSGLTLNRLAEQSGVSQSVLWHFMSDDATHRDIRLEGTADKLAEFFQMRLTKPKTPKP